MVFCLLSSVIMLFVAHRVPGTECRVRTILQGHPCFTSAVTMGADASESPIHSAPWAV